MSRIRLIPLLVATTASLLADCAAWAGPLQQASVSNIINQVSLVDPEAGARPASVGDLIKNELGVRTGIRSRAELTFQDQTLTRLGPETYFSFQPGTRELTLKQGTMLLQCPKNIGGARIHTAAITASILGTTIMLEYLPGSSVKVLVLEGTLRLSLNHHVGEAVLLHPGKMVIMRPDSNKIPDPVDVDLRHIVNTSSLVNPKLFSAKGKDGAPLPSINLIEHEIAMQEGLKNSKGLIDTNLLIMGQGTNVTIASNTQLAALDNRSRPADALPVVTPTPAPAVTPDPSPVPVIVQNIPSPTPTPPVYVSTPTPTPATPTPTPSTPTPSPTPGTPTPSPTPSTPTPSPTPSTPTPSPSPIAVTLPGPGAFPTPDTGATIPSPGSGSTADPLPVVQASMPLNSQVTISTNNGNPFITKNGTNLAGTVYHGSALDGPASTFLFGTESAFDAAIHLDSNFGAALGTAFPSAGVAVFEMSDIKINGSPSFNTSGGQSDIALVSDGDFNFSGGSGDWALDGITSLFIGTNNGNVNLNANRAITAIASNPLLNLLRIYAANNGHGDANVESKTAFNIPGASLLVEADHDVNLKGQVTDVNTVIEALHNLNFTGAINSSGIVQFWSGGDITANGTIVAPTFYAAGTNFNYNGYITASNVGINTSGNINGTGKGVIFGRDVLLFAGGSLTLNSSNTNQPIFDLSLINTFNATAGTIKLDGNFILPSGATGALRAGAGGIQGAGFDLTGFQTVDITGGSGTLKNLSAGSVTVIGGDLTIGGSLTADTVAVDGNLNVTGAIAPLTTSPASTSHTLGALNITAGSGLNFAGASSAALLTAPGDGMQLGLFSPGTVTFDTAAINGANFNGGNAYLTSLSNGGSGGMLDIGTLANPIGGDIVVNKPITATTGANALIVTSGGNGGTVNMVANGGISINSTVKVSESAIGKASARGGNISLTSNKTAGIAINVTSSGQLLALLAAAAPGPGGSINFSSAGGAINVNGGTLRADRGTINIQNQGANGQINLTNANITAGTFKAQALGANGQLTIGGGSITADNAIELYAPGSNGTVLFNDNVTLGGNSVKTIAGDSVTIANTKTVTIGGSNPANVFTNHANYTGSGGNGSTSGKFGGAGATTQAFGNRPAY